MIAMKPMLNNCGFSSAAGFKKIIEVSEVDFIVPAKNLTSPLAQLGIPANPSYSGFVRFPEFAVSAIGFCVYIAKIFNFVVKFVLVNMVDYIRREFSKYIEPSESMRWIPFVVYFYHMVSAENASNSSRFIHSMFPDKPSELSGLRIVMQNFFKLGLGYTFTSHWSTSSRLMIRGGVLQHPVPAL